VQVEEMATRSDESEAERLLFREAVGDVDPLKQDRVPPQRPRPAPIPEQSLRDARDVIDSLLSGQHDSAEIETGEELLYIRRGLRPSVVRKLRRGQYAIEAELDLHGHRVPEAHEALREFLEHARQEGKRCVRVIHGKGLGSDGKIPVLKEKVNAWLRRMNIVLAFCSARPYDGGTGAAYVLLRKL
jgi:DNA-nicking Smr family endonuclease